MTFNAQLDPNWIAAKKHEATLPRSYPDGLGQDKELIMEFKAALNSSKDERDAVAFPPVKYIVNTASEFYDHTSFDNFNLNDWANRVDHNIIDENNNYFTRQSSPRRHKSRHI